VTDQETNLGNDPKRGIDLKAEGHKETHPLTDPSPGNPERRIGDPLLFD